MYLRGLSTLGDCSASYAVASSYATPNVEACTALGGSVTIENGFVVCRVPQKCAVAQVAPSNITINNANVSSNTNSNTVSPNIVTAVNTQVNPTFAQTQTAPQTTTTTTAIQQPQQQSQVTTPQQATAAQQNTQSNQDRIVAQYSEAVYSLFNTYLGRNPAQSGLVYYATMMDQQGYQAAANDIANSPEAQQYARNKALAAQQAQQSAQQQAAQQAAAAATAQGATPAQAQQAGQAAAQNVAANQPVIAPGAPMVALDPNAPATYQAPVGQSASWSGGSPASVDGGAAPAVVSGMNPLVWVALAAVGLLVVNNNQRR